MILIRNYVYFWHCTKTDWGNSGWQNRPILYWEFDYHNTSAWLLLTLTPGNISASSYSVHVRSHSVQHWVLFIYHTWTCFFFCRQSPCLGMALWISTTIWTCSTLSTSKHYKQVQHSCSGHGGKVKAKATHPGSTLKCFYFMFQKKTSWLYQKYSREKVSIVTSGGFPLKRGMTMTADREGKIGLHPHLLLLGQDLSIFMCIKCLQY